MYITCSTHYLCGGGRCDLYGQRAQFGAQVQGAQRRLSTRGGRGGGRGRWRRLEHTDTRMRRLRMRVSVHSPVIAASGRSHQQYERTHVQWHPQQLSVHELLVRGREPPPPDRGVSPQRGQSLLGGDLLPRQPLHLVLTFALLPPQHLSTTDRSDYSRTAHPTARLSLHSARAVS